MSNLAWFLTGAGGALYLVIGGYVAAYSMEREAVWSPGQAWRYFVTRALLWPLVLLLSAYDR